MKYYITLLFFIIFFNCCKKQQLNDVEYIQISLNNNFINASAFIKEVRVIKLETNDDCLIQRISKIKYYNKNIFILDIFQNSLMIFNDDGNFEKKLSKVGQGPGDYIQIMDFFIQDDFLYILDFPNQSILKYDFNFQYLGKYNYKTFGSQFVIKDNICWINNEPTGQKNDYQFTSISENSVELNKFLPRRFLSHEYNWSDVNTFAIFDNKLYSSPKYRNIIYKEINNNLIPAYEIKFDLKNFPQNENINDYDINSPNFRYVLKRNFYVSNQFLIFDYINNNKIHFCVHDMKNKETNFGIVHNDLINDFRFFPRWGNGNYLLEEVESIYVIEDFFSLINYNKKIMEIQEDDNPVIIIYTLKS